MASSTGQATPRRTPGALKGRIKIHDGFGELPLDIATAFGIVEDELAELKKRMGR
jgi:hypothetical protein